MTVSKRSCRYSRPTSGASCSPWARRVWNASRTRERIVESSVMTVADASSSATPWPGVHSVGEPVGLSSAQKESTRATAPNGTGCTPEAMHPMLCAAHGPHRGTSVASARKIFVGDPSSPVHSVRLKLFPEAQVKRTAKRLSQPTRSFSHKVGVRMGRASGHSSCVGARPLGHPSEPRRSRSHGEAPPLPPVTTRLPVELLGETPTGDETMCENADRPQLWAGRRTCQMGR